MGTGGPAVRLGLDQVRTLGDDTARRIVARRDTGGPYTSIADLARRAALSTTHLEALATADAFACLGLTRREALWAAGPAAQDTPDQLPGTLTGVHAPDPARHGRRRPARRRRVGHRPDPRQSPHPTRPRPPRRSRRAADRPAAHVPDRTRILVGGLVTHRQRPATAGGITFLNLEDETGMLNVVVSEEPGDDSAPRDDQPRTAHPRHAAIRVRRTQPRRRTHPPTRDLHNTNQPGLPVKIWQVPA